MAADPLDSLRLALMQEVLPVGLAVAERVRKGGPAGVLAAFDGNTPDPLGRLREEGEPAAREVRDSLDRLQPGLGNPVMKVEVRDMAPETGPAGAASVQEAATAGNAGPDPEDPAELLAALSRIEARLALLQSRIG